MKALMLQVKPFTGDEVNQCSILVYYRQLKSDVKKLPGIKCYSFSTRDRAKIKKRLE
jgi:hypothetical protein